MNKYKPWELHIWNLHKYLKIFKNANALVVKNLRSLGPSVSHLSIFFLIFLWVNMSISYNSILICRFFWGVCWVFLAAWDFISCSALASLVVACELSCPLACRILRAWSNLCPPALEGGFLTTGPLGNPLYAFWVHFCCCSITQSCLTLWDTMNCSIPGFPVLHYLLELAHTHVLWVGDAIQPSCLLSSPSPVFNLSQYQDLF